MTFPFLAGTRPGAEALGEGPTIYVPALTAATTNPDLGSAGTAVGWYIRVGPNFVSGAAEFLFSGTGISAGSGAYFISLPLPPDESLLNPWSGTTGTIAGLGTPIGVATCRDNSATSASRTGVTVVVTGARCAVQSDQAAGAWGSATPFTWAASDRLRAEFSYPIETGT